MFEFSGLAIYTGSFLSVLDKVDLLIRQNKRGYICVTGAHGIVESQKNYSVFIAHKNATLVVPDGMPLVWLGRISGHPETVRIYGPDLMHAVCDRAEERRWRILLFGTTPQTLRLLKERLTNEFPNLIIADGISPPFRPLRLKEEKEIAKKITKAKPDVLFVGLSTPKQEVWMNEFSKKLPPTVMIGVGAAFDYLSGTKQQAPRWIRKTGFEWLYRLCMEPTRLLKRYAVTNTRFLRYAFTYLWRIRTERRRCPP